MPIYEFQCDACGEPFEELFRSARERRRPHCPGCGSGNVHKKLSTFAMTGDGEDGASGGASGGCGSCSRSSCAGCTG
jgi:putative FmdB family regulatory protein